VYCSITGFGQSGPYANRAGYDFLIQGMGGLMSVTGAKDGEPGSGPQKVGVALTDILTGLYAAVAMLGALAHRDRTGKASTSIWRIARRAGGLPCQPGDELSGDRRCAEAHGKRASQHRALPGFPTADGDMILAIGNDSQFVRFCELAGRPEWAGDPRFTTNARRVANRDHLIPLMRQATVMRTTRAWIDLFEAAGVPCGPINDLAGVFADPQVVARGLHVELQHPVAGRVPLVANPIRYSATPIEYRTAPPELGCDTASALLDWLSCDVARIADLLEQGAIAA
jgi:crotonobetainyl-CoA:carnitine CoA-transferase CaiB-like acyl-CoA transferase